MNEVLRLTSLTKRYNNSQALALDHVSLELRSGRIVGLSLIHI